MEEVKSIRTLEQVDAEYKEHCQACGHRQYQIAILEAELVHLNNKMIALNKEADSLKKEKVE